MKLERTFQILMMQRYTNIAQPLDIASFALLLTTSVHHIILNQQTGVSNGTNTANRISIF